MAFTSLRHDLNQQEREALAPLFPTFYLFTLGLYHCFSCLARGFSQIPGLFFNILTNWREYDRPGIYLMETTRINNIKQRYDNGAQFPELLIANYDLRERSRAVPSQMTLFDWNGGEAIG